MSIEDFVSQPGRERLRRLHPLYIDNSTWFEESGNGISKSMLRMMYGLLKEPYPRYTSMPREDRDLWFKQFAQDFNWERDLTTEVRRMFDVEMAREFSHTVNQWKQKWVLGETPKCINEKVYEGLKDHWIQPATKKTSSTNSNNRNSRRGGKGISTHNAGSTSFFTRGKQLTTRDGVAPDHLTLMEDTHTNKKTKEIQDQVAKQVIEVCRKRKDEYILSQPPLDDDGQPPKVPLELMNQIVLEETPKTKGRIFGLGKLGKRTRSHPTSSYMYNRDPELERALQEKDDRIEVLEKLMEEEKQANKKRDEEIAKKDAEMAKFMQDVLSRLPPNSSS
ncbi:putative transposase Ptta/En/Spm plant [Arabidopsis suecica]|uniref:Putative transposase Ptta/En/Spm plant n=2 Tax=Arabidopsis suecica TaxID=45249 RepID=A0A8T2HHS9_ARASU|nr:putative transposase Ptta/En/Spm plant [Arabidopsis suecica]